MRGVVPTNESSGANDPSNKIREKNPAPVRASTVGVTRAAAVQPNLWKMKRPKIIMMRVMVPVAVLKLPCSSFQNDLKARENHACGGGTVGSIDLCGSAWFHYGKKRDLLPRKNNDDQDMTEGI